MPAYLSASGRELLLCATAPRRRAPETRFSNAASVVCPLRRHARLAAKRGRANPPAITTFRPGRRKGQQGVRLSARPRGRPRRFTAAWRSGPRRGTPWCRRLGCRAAPGTEAYLVDPASSICLSQRLSHACLSTNGLYSETAKGSLNQLWFL